MKKIFVFGVLALALIICGCGAKEAAATGGQAAPAASKAAQAAPAQENKAAAKLLLKLENKEVSVVLADNTAVQSVLNQLPAAVSFSDFNNTEKIAYLPQKLKLDGAPKGHAPKAGDMCIYAPWGNICIFYRDYKFSSDLIYLGHVEQGLETLSSQQGDFKANLVLAK